MSYGPCSACGDGDTAMRYHSHDDGEKSYALAEIEQLAEEWTKTQELTSNDRWLISHLFAWLKRREKEEGGR